MPFEKIGQLEKAPVLTDRSRERGHSRRPNRPLIRVVCAWVRAESELHHDVHRETTARRLAGVGSKEWSRAVGRLADLPVVQLTDENVSIHPLF